MPGLPFTLPSFLPGDGDGPSPVTEIGRTRYSFIRAMVTISPPWLRRLVGGAMMESLGVPVETVLDRTIASVKQRFPNEANPQALGYIGRERRIIRGVNEDAATYAARLILWWDSHRTRGNAYALLTQAHAYFVNAENPEIDLIANSGRRHTVAPDGTITRGDFAAWTGDGEYPDKWARFFFILNLPQDKIFGENIYTLTPEHVESISTVPREWSAAHIDKIYIRVLPVNGILWGYPESLTWGEPGRTWGGDLGLAWTT